MTSINLKKINTMFDKKLFVTMLCALIAFSLINEFVIEPMAEKAKEKLDEMLEG